ncbi:hypothetical protein ADK75_06175 [Streptomyces virginiae]|uniref:Uncharacterized protein n=1 Tax=Streptomyces virginiae TaxID=1961 RepID=A0A0L8N2J5_STRVG|nr:hypothetical protein ADK75_06175 [Streptomyces virginiae]
MRRQSRRIFQVFMLEDVFDAGADLLVGEVVLALPVAQIAARWTAVWHDESVTRWPSSAIVVVLPTAAFAPESVRLCSRCVGPGEMCPHNDQVHVGVDDDLVVECR